MRNLDAASMTALGMLRSHFEATDALRRVQREAIASFGLRPCESPYLVTASGPYWRLRDYGNQHAGRSLLIVAAPIKRPYIWDLARSISAIRFCLERGLHVRLLEWLPGSASTDNVGLEECTQAIAHCASHAMDEDNGSPSFLAGHSLGGTLAAIYAASAAASIQGLILLSAPLCFQAGQSGFRDALVSMVPPQPPGVGCYPGSLLTQISALAAPGAFLWSRWIDGLLSLTDEHAAEIHARVEYWALDEVALPGKLVRQIFEDLYRNDSFYRGSLDIGGRPVGPATLKVPVLAVVNTADEVAPMTAVKPFAEALPMANLGILDHPGEIGVCLQHLAILVGRAAKVTVWPEIMTWMQSVAAGPHEPADGGLSSREDGR